MNPDETLNSMLNFCLIQIQVLAERKERLRKELLNCKIQEEYLSSVLDTLQKQIVHTGGTNE